MAFKMNITAQIRLSNPTSPLKAMLIPKLDQAAEGLVQAGFECIQAWRFCSLFWHLFWYLIMCIVKILFPLCFNTGHFANVHVSFPHASFYLHHCNACDTNTVITLSSWGTLSALIPAVNSCGQEGAENLKEQECSYMPNQHPGTQSFCITFFICSVCFCILFGATNFLVVKCVEM